MLLSQLVLLMHDLTSRAAAMGQSHLTITSSCTDRSGFFLASSGAMMLGLGLIC